ncbi:B- and T-lymphocyte attenuator isoform X1 [Notechis scutatus]|uniref:B- and T-lymphocyte attenuator isoform X1 n=1 Tax=Notechis scutatus TaxID=8663 RepID=A0A6J1TPH8_9SAUR|nr:B- and T-lymphocyte attenuator isoform X1 [Notechis scutatus]
MYIGNVALLLLLLMLMVDNSLTHDSEDDNCTTITIERGTKYYKNLGDSASLECPVTYCSKKPKMNWYMLNKSKETFHILKDEKEHSISWKNENTFVLNFQSVHKNDSGQYRCEAIVRKNNLASHVVELIVQDHSNSSVFLNTTNTTEDQKPAEKNKMLIMIYSISSFGTLFLIVGYFGWLYFTRRHQVKNTQKVKSQESGNNRKTQRCTDSTTHESDEGAIFIEDSMPGLFQVSSGNQDNYQKASRTSLSSMKFNEGLSGYKEDSVIYATLSHGELFQRTKPPEETQLTEYAIIRLKS